MGSAMGMESTIGMRSTMSIGSTMGMRSTMSMGSTMGMGSTIGIEYISGIWCPLSGYKFFKVPREYNPAMKNMREKKRSFEDRCL